MLTHRGMLAHSRNVRGTRGSTPDRRAAGGDAALPRRRHELCADGAQRRRAPSHMLRTPDPAAALDDARGREDHAHVPRARAAWRRWRRCPAPPSATTPSLAVALLRRFADAAAGAAGLRCARSRADCEQVYGMTEQRARSPCSAAADHEQPGGRAPARLGGPADPGRGDRDPRSRDRRSRRRSASPARSGCAATSVMSGYWGKPEATAATITPGRLAALRRRRAPGRRRLSLHHRPHQGHDHQRRREHLPGRDRARAGRAPAASATCAVIGVPDERWGEVPKAVVVASAGRRPSTPTHCSPAAAQHLAAFKCPKSVDVLAELPRNPTGKVLKKDLRKPYWPAGVSI